MIQYGKIQKSVYVGCMCVCICSAVLYVCMLLLLTPYMWVFYFELGITKMIT